MRRGFRDSRYVYDIEKGSWVLNTRGEANELGYNEAVSTDYSMAREDEGFRFKREERSLARNYVYDRLPTLLEGSTLETKRRRRKKLIRHSWGSGWHGHEIAPSPCLPVKNYAESILPSNLDITKDLVRTLPSSCSSCSYRHSCSTWIGLLCERSGIRLCPYAKDNHPFPVDGLRRENWKESFNGIPKRTKTY